MTTDYRRSPWEDRFNEPTLRQLRQELPAANRALLDRMRRHIAELDGIRERPAWYGDTWKWTLEYRTKGSDEEPLALIIPSPNDLQLAIPLDPEFASSLPVKRMKRAVRDGLELAQEPFDTRWAIWSLQAGSLLNDLADLLALKHRHLLRAAG